MRQGNNALSAFLRESAQHSKVAGPVAQTGAAGFPLDLYRLAKALEAGKTDIASCASALGVSEADTLRLIATASERQLVELQDRRFRVTDKGREWLAEQTRNLLSI